MDNTEGNIPFMITWAFPSEVKKTLGASWFELDSYPEDSKQEFSSGRPRKLVRFYGKGYGSSREVLTEREAMELVSVATGLPYIVCRRAAPVPRDPAPPAKLVMKRQVTGAP
jgi:hypothetical protein